MGEARPLQESSNLSIVGRRAIKGKGRERKREKVKRTEEGKEGERHRGREVNRKN